MERKADYKIKYGTSLLEELTGEKNIKWLIVTQENLWKQFHEKIKTDNYDTYMVTSMDLAFIQEEIKKHTDYDAVIGLGGGLAIDMAKYFSWQHNKPLYSVPTIASVNACLTYKTAVREDNKVRYIGEALPVCVYIDYDIIKSAPAFLNIAGIGDIFSCHTGLYDWKLIDARVGNPPYDEAVAQGARKMLENLYKNIDEIKNVTDEGIKFIFDSYKWIGENGYRMKHSRFEEGSEHYYAYTLESIAKKPMVHGRIVCLGIYFMSKLQNNNHERAVEIIKESHIGIRPEDIGVTMEEITAALKTANDYVVLEKKHYSILNEKKITQEFIGRALKEYKQDFNIN